LVERQGQGTLPARWACLRLLEGDASGRLAPLRQGASIAGILEELWREHAPGEYSDAAAQGLADRAAVLARKAVLGGGRGYSPRDRALDRLLTGRWTAFPLMGLLLLFLLWLTMVG